MADTTITIRLPRWQRLPAILVFAIALAAAPVVLASDRYSDVPTSNTFHTNINNIAAAGITTGCAPDMYCPKADVTREQMAAFLNRTGGRAAYVSFATPLGNTPGQQPNNNTVLATTSITLIGHQALVMRADFYTFTYAGSGTFPCEIAYRFRINGSPVGNTVMFDRFNAAPPNTWETRMISGELLYPLPAGTYTVSLTYQRVTNGCSSYPGNGTLIVENVPFRQDGAAWGGLVSSADGPIEVVGTETTQSNGEPIE